MYPVLIVSGLVLGAVIGSFLNVATYRVPAGMSLAYPASHCPHCSTPIRAKHNVPIIGWVMLRGRCAACNSRISKQYPLVEGLTAVIFAITALWAYRQGNMPVLPALWYFMALAVALTAIDMKHHRLPDRIVFPAYPIVTGLLLIATLITGQWSALLSAGIGAVALFGFYFLLAMIYPAGMGFGDVKLAGIVGGILGYFGYSILIIGAFASFAFGSVVAIVLIALRRGSGKTAMPFGPFMFLGAITAIAFGEVISEQYMRMVGL